MNTRSNRPPFLVEGALAIISVLVLIVCFLYLFIYGFLVPYPGIGLETGDGGWVVIAVDACDTHPGWCETNSNLIQVGDEVVAIGDLNYDDYRQDRRKVRFGSYRPGDFVPITSIRDGEMQTFFWQMPIITLANRLERLSSALFFLPFWIVGTAVLLFLRPRSIGWRLLIAMNYLTAIWLAVGLVSPSQVAASSLTLHAISWGLVPIYLHLHILVPVPLFKNLPRNLLLPILYTVAVILASLELVQLLPSNAYSIGVLLSIAGSIGLLLTQVFNRSSLSGQAAARLMLVGIGLAFGPGVVVDILPELLGNSEPSALETGVALLAIPIFPLFYAYAIFKHHLGELEFRANRLLGAYSFVLLYATTFAFVLMISRRWTTSTESTYIISLVAVLVFVMSAPALRTRYQRIIDRLAYGAKHDPDEVLGLLASQLPGTVEYSSLVRLLADEIVPSLLIRQSAMVLLQNGDVEWLYSQGVDFRSTAISSQQIEQLLAEVDHYLPPLERTTIALDTRPDRLKFDWVRLAIPLVSREHTIGIWLFGRRDPDDYYPRQDIELLTTLANQIAVTIENARLFKQVRSGRDRLRELSRRLVQMQEVERRHVANELHDEIGQNLTGLKLTLGTVAVQGERVPKVDQLREAKIIVDELIDKVQDLSLDLRPPMLDDLGLLPTLLWHIQRYRTQTGVDVAIKHRDLKNQFSPAVEIAAYRIVQEALTNVAKHASVKKADVSVWFDSAENEIYIRVEDKGSGFDYQAAVNKGRASGLVGMHERAVFLGGHIKINTILGRGTTLEAWLPLEEH